MDQTERAAAQAYVRLLEAARAALADPGEAPVHLPLLTSPMREADQALRGAGLTGNEDRLFALVRELRPGFTSTGGHSGRRPPAPMA